MKYKKLHILAISIDNLVDVLKYNFFKNLLLRKNLKIKRIRFKKFKINLIPE
jgi:hypothetical protein